MTELPSYLTDNSYVIHVRLSYIYFCLAVMSSSLYLFVFHLVLVKTNIIFMYVPIIFTYARISIISIFIYKFIFQNIYFLSLIRVSCLITISEILTHEVISICAVLIQIHPVYNYATPTAVFYHSLIYSDVLLMNIIVAWWMEFKYFQTKFRLLLFG